MKGMARLLMALIVVAGLAMPTASRALGWEAMWRNADQRAAHHMEREEYAEAAGTFNDAQWRAAALYRAGEYQAAAETWSALDDVQAHYNRGNALARAGDLPAAVEAYETVLARDPDHADARYNLELLREHMQNDDEREDGEPRQDENRQGDQQDDKKGEGGNGDTGQQQDRRGAGRQDGNERDGRPPDASPREPQAGQESQSDEEGSGDQPGDRQSDEPDQSPATPMERDDPEQDGDAAMSAQSEADSDDPAEQAAMEQWLRRIPDDPGGLLRRKFRYQYQRRERGEDEVREPW